MPQNSRAWINRLAVILRSVARCFREECRTYSLVGAFAQSRCYVACNKSCIPFFRKGSEMYKQILSSLTANRSVPWNLSIQGFIPRLLAVSINGEIAQIPPRGGQLRQWCPRRSLEPYCYGHYRRNQCCQAEELANKSSTNSLQAVRTYADVVWVAIINTK